MKLIGTTKKLFGNTVNVSLSRYLVWKILKMEAGAVDNNLLKSKQCPKIVASAIQSRLKRELAKISNSPPEGLSISLKDDSFKHLEAKIIGPNGTPYKNGLFKLEVLIPDRYPFSPPSIKFITKIYHPNIDDNGRICLDLIKMPPAGNWKPTLGLEGLLIAIRMLLATPNPDDPLMAEIAEEYKTCQGEFQRKAKEYTEKYASNS